ncbi:RNA polymerase sigma factor [Brucellaceae bacterium C25G]
MMVVRKREFETLYLDERPGLLRRAMRRLGSAAVASDLVQDVFLRLWERRSEPLDDEAAYLGKSVQYAIIDHMRAERVRQELAIHLLPEQYAAPVATPLDIIEPRDEMRRMDDIIRSLPERTRHIFLLNKVHGCKYCEIAEVLDISRSAVEKHMARAMMACRGIRE